MAALVAVLALLPTAVRALPVTGSDLTAGQLRDRIRAGASVGWSGTSESRTGLALPDVSDLGSLPALLGGTTRTRVWWRGPLDWRVDEQRAAGEQDVIFTQDTTVTWTSADRTVQVVTGDLPVRLPRATDLVAPVLGRRLAGAPDTLLSRLPSRRIAGVSAAGLRLVPRVPSSSTVASVEIWADPASGLALQVELRARGQDRPVLTTLLLDLDRHTPPAARTVFADPRGATVTSAAAPDVAAEVDQAVPYVLPRQLAGSERQVLAGFEQVRGVGTYGAGLAAFAVVPLPRDVAARLSRRLAAVGGPQLSTPLINALVGHAGRRTYLLVGTVPQGVLARAFRELESNPPPRTRR